MTGNIVTDVLYTNVPGKWVYVGYHTSTFDFAKLDEIVGSFERAASFVPMTDWVCPYEDLDEEKENE